MYRIFALMFGTFGTYIIKITWVKGVFNCIAYTLK